MSRGGAIAGVHYSQDLSEYSARSSYRQIKNKGRNYWFPSLDCLVGGLVGGLVDRVQLLRVCGEFAVAF